MAESLLLKWGTLKGWELEKDETKNILKNYYALGVSASCMMQHDTPEHKKLLCDLIDAIDGDIQSDWSGEMMSKDEAKKYINTYGDLTECRPLPERPERPLE